MTEIWESCQWGPTHTRASGIFRAQCVGPFGRRTTHIYMLCADCAFNKLYAHVRCVLIPDTDEVIVYHDVVKVDLLKSLTTDFVPPAEKPIIPSIARLKVIKSRMPSKPLKLQFITDTDFNPNPEWLR